MALGSRTRQVGLSLAGLAVAALAGCHAMPVGKLATLPNRPQATFGSAGRAALLPATVAMEPPSELSSIEPVATRPASLTQAEPDQGPVAPAPTPLLDAALVKARSVEGPTPSVAEKAEIPPTAPEPVPIPAPVPPPSPPPEPVAAAFAPNPPAAEAVQPKPPEPSKPEDLWREGVRKLGGLARAGLEQAPAGATPWGLRARVLAWLAEPEVDLELGLGHRDSDGVAAVLRALDDSAVDPARRGDEVRSAVLVLEDKAPLEITDLRLCSKVEGFGDYEAFEPPVRKAGQPVILYCELDGLKFEQSAAGFRTKVAAQYEILSEGGGPPILARPLGPAEETSRRRRRDYYVVYKFALPESLGPGDYRLRLTARDLIADRSVARELGFAIDRP